MKSDETEAEIAAHGSLETHPRAEAFCPAPGDACCWFLTSDGRPCSIHGCKTDDYCDCPELLERS